MTILEPINCTTCGEMFVPSKPKQVFCSTNCRVKSHQAKKREEEKVNATEFKDLKSKPKHTVEILRELNKDWVILNENMANLSHDKHKLELQKEALILKSEKILKGNQGLIAALSAAVLVGGVALYGMSNDSGENEKNNKVEKIILALLLTLAISGLAFIIASKFGRDMNEKDSKIMSKVDLIMNDVRDIKNKIDIIDIEYTMLKEKIKLVPRYLKETKIETTVKDQIG
jgi:hypothetical protein